MLEQIEFEGFESKSSFDLWDGMPEYENSKQPAPFITATFKFKDQTDYDMFHSLVKKHIYNGEKVFDGMQSMEEKQAWYPLKDKASKFKYRDGHES